MRPTRHLALAALALAACGEPRAEPAFSPDGRGPERRPGDRLLGHWQVPEPTLPPTSIRISRDGATTRARVALSGITYEGLAVGDDTSVAVFAGERATIRGVLVDAGARLRIDHLDERGASRLTQVLVRVP